MIRNSQRYYTTLQHTFTKSTITTPTTAATSILSSTTPLTSICTPIPAHKSFSSQQPLRTPFLSSLIARVTGATFPQHKQNIAHAIASASKLKSGPKRSYPPILFIIGPPGAGKGTQSTLLELEFGGAISSVHDGTVLPDHVKSSIHKNQVDLATDKPVTLPSSSTSSTYGSISFQSANGKVQYTTVHVSIGALLRAEADRPNSPHAEEIRSVIQRGSILTGQLTTALIQSEVDRITAELKTSHPELTPVFLIDGFPRNVDNYEFFQNQMEEGKGMIRLDSSQANCLKRLLDRGQQSGRLDDTEEIIQVRHATYENTTVPLIAKVEQHAKSAAESSFPAFYVVDGNSNILEVYKQTRTVFGQYLRVHALNHGKADNKVQDPAVAQATA
jgi:adenylate kinase family enzyme